MNNQPDSQQEATELPESELQQLQSAQATRAISPISEESTLITEPITPHINVASIYPVAATATNYAATKQQTYGQQTTAATSAASDSHDNTTLSILIIIAGIIAIIVGGRSLFMGVASVQLVGKFSAANPMLGISTMLSLITAAAMVTAGIGFLLKKNWGRVLAIWTYVVGILLSLPLVLIFPPVLIGIFVNIVIIVLLNLNIVKDQFN